LEPDQAPKCYFSVPTIVTPVVLKEKIMMRNYRIVSILLLGALVFFIDESEAKDGLEGQWFVRKDSASQAIISLQFAKEGKLTRKIYTAQKELLVTNGTYKTEGLNLSVVLPDISINKNFSLEGYSLDYAGRSYIGAFNNGANMVEGKMFVSETKSALGVMRSTMQFINKTQMKISLEIGEKKNDSTATYISRNDSIIYTWDSGQTFLGMDVGGEVKSSPFILLKDGTAFIGKDRFIEKK
jgi:hypothetical protein